MAIAAKEKRTERIHYIDGTYDVEFEEVRRKRIYPEDEVREILANAIRDASHRDYSHLLDPCSEVARTTIDLIKERFELSIRPRKG